MKKWSLKEVLDNIIKNIQDAHSINMEGLIVDADSSKGFRYPYLLAYPKSNMRNTLIMDCLNDYEEPMPIIMPLIPGYLNDTLQHTASEK